MKDRTHKQTSAAHNNNPRNMIPFHCTSRTLTNKGNAEWLQSSLLQLNLV